MQTLPDWFEMPCSYTTAHRLIGNAVPPLLAWKIGIEIRKALEDNTPLGKGYGQIIEDRAEGSSCLSGRGSGKGRIIVKRGKAHLRKHKDGQNGQLRLPLKP